MRSYKAVFSALLLVTAVPALAATEKSLKAREVFARMDREDLLDGIEKASACTAQRDFSCADKALSEVKDLASNDSEEMLWKLAASSLQRERNQVAEEQRLQREEEERTEREERRLMAEAEAEEQRQQRAAAAEEKRRAVQYGLNSLAIAYGGSGLSPDKLNTLLEANARDYQQGGNGSNLQASLNQLKADNERRLQENQQKILAQKAQRQREQDELREATARQRERAQSASSYSAAGSAAASATTSASAISTPSAAALAAQRQQEEKSRKEREAQQVAERRSQEAATALAEQERQKKLAQENAEREARLAAVKAEREAKKAEEKAAAERAKKDYLQQVGQGVRLGLMKCYGEYHIRGSRPRIKPEVVSCVDVHYRARCESSTNYFARGVAKNFVGMDSGCFGDTYQISAPSCPVEKVVVEVEKATVCGEG